MFNPIIALAVTVINLLFKNPEIETMINRNV